MTTLQSTDSQTAAIADSTIEFRVSRPGSPRRRLKLVGSRYTIGSGAECSVRLDDQSVRPVHAVLVREQGRVGLRAYGSPILINGKAVTEASLFVADQFQIGAYTFELTVGPPPSVKSPSAKKSEPVAKRETVPEPENDDPNGLKVVPRRRLSFANAMQLTPAAEHGPRQTPKPAERAAEVSVAKERVVEPQQKLTQQPVASVAPSSTESTDSKLAEAAASATEEVLDNRETESVVADVATPSNVEQRTQIVDEPVVTEKNPGVERFSTRPMGADLFDQHRAILANERRWQERSKKQLEKFRQREEKSASQIEALRAAQDAAERRARSAEDAVEGLKQQVTELAGRVAAMASTVMPGLEQRIDQQYQESVVANRQYHSLVDGLRGRLDFLQTALNEVQADTEEIRLQTVATREDQQEFAANTETLEQTLQRMAEEFKAGRAEADEKDESLRQNLYQTSLKLADLTGQLEETRQNGHGLGAMVQQLRSSLQNAQTEAQRFATVEQIEETMRLLKANDQRISQLTEEYDNQSNQLQHECDALRQRLEQSERVASDALAAANEALNEAVDQRMKIESLVDAASVDAASVNVGSVNVGSDVQSLEMSTAEETTPPGSDPVALASPAALESSSVEDQQLVGNEDPWAATYVADSPRNEVSDSVEVSWFDADADGEVDSDAAGENRIDDSDDLEDGGSESLLDSGFSRLQSMLDREAEKPGANIPYETDAPEQRIDQEIAAAEELKASDSESSAADSEEADNVSVSQSQFHLPLEIAAPEDGHTYQGPRPVGSQHTNQVVDSSSQEDFDDDYAGATYQYDPAADAGFGSFQVPKVESEADHLADDVSNVADAGVAGIGGDAELQDSYGATAFLDGPIMSNVEDDQEEAPDPVAGTKSGPRSAAEVLASLGIELDAGDESDVPEPAVSGARAADVYHEPEPTPEPQVASSPATAEATEEDEDSIEAYMNRLLRRVQGQSETETVGSNPVSQTVEPTVNRASVASTRVTATPTAETMAEPVSPNQTTQSSPNALADSPYVPRSQAPERSSNLAAMRELANSSARTAIATSARKKMSNDVLFKYALFGMGLLAGGAVLVGTRFEVGPWMLIALCCIGLAGFFLLEGFNLSKQLSENRPGSGENQSAESAG